MTTKNKTNWRNCYSFASGVQTPVCAVSGAKFLTESGWVDLRNSVDSDVPFRLFRDEGRTFLQVSSLRLFDVFEFISNVIVSVDRGTGTTESDVWPFNFGAFNV